MLLNTNRQTTQALLGFKGLNIIKIQACDYHKPPHVTDDRKRRLCLLRVEQCQCLGIRSRIELCVEGK